MKRMDIILFLPVLLFLSGYMVGQETRELQTAKQLRVFSFGGLTGKKIGQTFATD